MREWRTYLLSELSLIIGLVPAYTYRIRLASSVEEQHYRYNLILIIWVYNDTWAKLGVSTLKSITSSLWISKSNSYNIYSVFFMFNIWPDFAGLQYF